MANLCSTDYVFMGPKDQVLKFKEEVVLGTSKNFFQNSFGTSWLGNLIYHFELGTHEEIRCRGKITHLSDELRVEGDNAFFELGTDTAWEPMILLWDLILEKYFPDIEYVMYSEGPGEEIYINTDIFGKFFTTRYRANFGLKDDEDNQLEEYYDTEKEALREINDFFKTDYISLVGAEIGLNLPEDNTFLDFYKFEESWE